VGLVELPFRIKFSLSGKISGDELPSSQVAKRYVNNDEKIFILIRFNLTAFFFARCKYYAYQKRDLNAISFLEIRIRKRC
jgi:hypothetical protein